MGHVGFEGLEGIQIEVPAGDGGALAGELEIEQGVGVRIHPYLPAGGNAEGIPEFGIGVYPVLEEPDIAADPVRLSAGKASREEKRRRRKEGAKAFDAGEGSHDQKKVSEESTKRSWELVSKLAEACVKWILTMWPRRSKYRMRVLWVR
ncbi:MAG: hypothetical protein K0Q91_2058 [Fibrobacteria bacterium]|nr:hypothetical protein [Fibrobacteria bacterium]